MTTPRRSHDLSGLLPAARSTAPTPLTPEQELVGGWITLWLDGRMTEAEMTQRLNADFWHADGMTWTEWTAHGGHVRHVLVQAREAEREWRESAPACGPTALWTQAECDAQSRCGRCRAHDNRWLDTVVTLHGELVWAVPQRARASVEASRAARDGMGEAKGGSRND